VNLESAVAFVRSQGNAVEQARLTHLLDDEPPAPEAVNDLLAGQRSDGGWPPFWASDYSSLDATCFRLAQAEQMGITSSETAITRAVRFLVRRQRSDGSWEEDETVASVAPPWAKPGDLSARLYLTANCGFWLAILDRTDDAALRTAGYLRTHIDRDGHLPGFPHTHWLAGGLWYRLNWRESAERVLSYLSRRLYDLPASNLAWLITTLLDARVPASHTVVDTAASLLEQCQDHDGRWPSEDGSEWDVHATLEALRALRLCGRF
jgi:hypothetical protein